MILLITNSRDLTATYVCNQWDQTNVPYVRLNTDEVLEKRYHFQIAQNSSSYIIQTEEREVNADSVTSVWYRKPKFPKASSEITDPQIRKAIEQEAEIFLRNIYGIFGNKLWVSHPDQIRGAGLKLEQLERAKSSNFAIPDTIVSNVPASIESFVRLHGQNVIMKTFLPVSYENGNQLYGAYATKVTDEILQQLDALTLCPIIFQKEVVKAKEVRITLIGEEVFPAAAVPPSTLDWRAEAAGLRWEELTIPSELEENCKKFLKHYGLRFGAFDFALTPEGEFVFFEMNPNGQWGWIEEQTGMPMTKALTNLLLT